MSVGNLRGTFFSDLSDRDQLVRLFIQRFKKKYLKNNTCLIHHLKPMAWPEKITGFWSPRRWGAGPRDHRGVISHPEE